MEHRNAPEALYKVNTGLGSNAVADQNLERNLLLQEGTTNINVRPKYSGIRDHRPSDPMAAAGRAQTGFP